MKRLLLICLLLFTAALANGCAHRSVANIPHGMAADSSYEEKIPGKFAIVVDVDDSLLNRTVSPSTYYCSAWNYPLEFANSFHAGVIRASAHIFREAVTSRQVPTRDVAASEGYSGYVLVRLKHFDPSIRFSQGFFTASAHATVAIGISFVVKDANGNTLMSSAANASRSVDGDGGGACGGGATVLVDAVGKATREMLEQYVENIANSHKLRASLSDNKTNRP